MIDYSAHAELVGSRRLTELSEHGELPWSALDPAQTRSERSVRHHFVPQFWVKRWRRRDKTVSVFDRTKGARTYKQTKQVFVIPDLYTMTDDAGQPSDILERNIGKRESRWAEVIRQIIKREQVSNDDEPALREFITYQYMRIPRMQKMAEEILRYKFAEEANPETAKIVTSDTYDPLLRKRAQDGLRSHGKQFPLKNIATEPFNMIVRNRAELDRRNWRFLIIKTQTSGIFLGDEPILLIGQSGSDSRQMPGLLNADEIWCPIGPAHALVLTQDITLPKSPVWLKASAVRQRNRRMVLQAQREVVIPPNYKIRNELGVPRKPPTQSWGPNGIYIERAQLSGEQAISIKDLDRSHHI